MALVGGALVLLLVLAIGFYFLILDWDVRPFCHKQINLGMRMWVQEYEVVGDSITNAFPNVGGKSLDSLTAINEYMGRQTNWIRGYKYIPGLRESDPGDLILMYLDRPTRWTWHGRPPSIFQDKAWIVVPVDFTMSWPQRKTSGELSERISLTEFKTRLERTLDFVRTNERPNWQSVVDEHTRFLKSIEHTGQ
jgi:hypothetical protein